MPAQRSPHDRRRRVLYWAHQAQHADGAGASRTAVERLRAARRPTAMYGERVQRRLEGRWFSLVPVEQRTFNLVALVLLSVVGVLCGLHYLSVAWPWLAEQEKLTRPLRVDHSDSIGRWILILLLLVISGVALLTYQLRRYRLDDFTGRYRLWRTVLIVSGISSLAVCIDLIDWLGAGLDLIFGQRVALTGADWLRLLISTAAAVMTFRLIAEVYRSRFALGALLIAVACLALPQAVHWHLFDISGPLTWSVITCAPLVGTSILFLSLGSYLRLLHREVCQIEDGPSLRERMGQLGIKIFHREKALGEPESEAIQVATKSKQKSSRSGESDEGTVEERPQPDDRHRSTSKRRWWQRQAKPNTQPAETSSAETTSPEDSSSTDEAIGDAKETDDRSSTKRRRFGLGSLVRSRKPNATSSPESPSVETIESAANDTEEIDGTDDADEKVTEAQPPKKRRFGLGGMFARKSAESTQPENDDPDSSDEDSTPETENPTNSEETTENTDEIDWASLSKSERRKLRKQLKRQGRAA